MINRGDCILKETDVNSYFITPYSIRDTFHCYIIQRLYVFSDWDDKQALCDLCIADNIGGRIRHCMNNVMVLEVYPGYGLFES
jgi:hypothetical protein